jgi:hypothetical protein
MCLFVTVSQTTSLKNRHHSGTPQDDPAQCRHRRPGLPAPEPLVVCKTEEALEDAAGLERSDVFVSGGHPRPSELARRAVGPRAVSLESAAGSARTALDIAARQVTQRAVVGANVSHCYPYRRCLVSVLGGGLQRNRWQQEGNRVLGRTFGGTAPVRSAPDPEEVRREPTSSSTSTVPCGPSLFGAVTGEPVTEQRLAEIELSRAYTPHTRPAPRRPCDTPSPWSVRASWRGASRPSRATRAWR